MNEEDLSVDYELAQRQCAQLHGEGTASLEASIAATEAWADRQTVERWGTEPGAIAFRLAYRDFLDRFVTHLKGDIAELNEFTSRLQAALRRFQNNEEELEMVVKDIVSDIAKKSEKGGFAPDDVPTDMLGISLPPNVRME
ncbi:hypothetical protein [Buchananella hordeovulneris]|uniref:Uncharacterized protein n=1 Tax=Buchananella hordeovulneris TaxID=52770 RepID=A0A1Q5PTA3_9ACTO|nr:hypothetical protein [Buchananella hordeovulneris]OKL50756.1 hypothetical protein BSZ40_10725 [Buchananella hordeovulneris]